MKNENKEPFKRKSYKDYDEYLFHQKSKLDSGIPWLNKYVKFYSTLLAGLLNRTKLSFAGKSVLCLGSRQGTEVEVFTKQLGCFSIGIDVNPGENNKFVVTGDASEIQYPNKCVDIVYTNALDHFLRINRTISEIRRVLKISGYFIFLIGSPKDAKIDKFGSTYWNSVDSVVEYICSKAGFKLVKKWDVSQTNWFDRFIVLEKL